MRIKIERHPPFVVEKDSRVPPAAGGMQHAFQNLEGLRLACESIGDLEDGTRVCWVKVSTLTTALKNADKLSAFHRWTAHWSKIGYAPASLVGIPADCCRVLEEAKQ